jgi:long-subunit acyl-CoA synthetase (AMP-forming)
MWSIEPNQHLVVRRAQTDSAVEFEPTSVVAVFTAAVEKFGDKPALYGVRNDVPNEWDMLTYAEYYDKCMLFARALLSYELDPYSIINILGFNAPEWLIANCGSIMASCIPAGKYPSSSPPACHQIAKFSRTSVLVLDGRAQLMKYVEAFMEARADSSDPTNPFPHLRLVIVWGEPISDDIAGILTGRT